MGLNTLQRRYAERTHGAIRIDQAVAPPLPAGLEELLYPCCEGAAYRGFGYCTCWEPVYDLPQVPTADLNVGGLVTAALKCCHDCAYRPDSPEQADDWSREELQNLRYEPASAFWCHQGMRRVTHWRHAALGEQAVELGLLEHVVAGALQLEAGAGDYQPPIVGSTAYLASGEPALLCAGWAAHAGVRHTRKVLAGIRGSSL